MTYINIPTYEFKKLVNSLQERVQAHKTAEEDVLIEKRMKRKFFRDLTREEAILSLNRDDLISDWGLRKLKYHTIDETISRLINLYEIAESSRVQFVALSSEDAEQLQRFK